MADAQVPTRRIQATAAEVEIAVTALSRPTLRARDWPGDLHGLSQPGLYAWWVDADGADTLSAGLGLDVLPGRIYAGQTGATRWPSGQTGSATLRSRIGGNHLRGQITASTFRLTLAAVLREPERLTVAGPRRLTTESQKRLSGWMRQHLVLALHPYEDPDPLGDLERRTLAVLDPPLNLEGMVSTPMRLRLSALRSELGRA